MIKWVEKLFTTEDTKGIISQIEYVENFVSSAFFVVIL